MADPPGKKTPAERLAYWLDRRLVFAMSRGVQVLDRAGKPVLDDAGKVVRREAGADVLSVAARRLEQLRAAREAEPGLTLHGPPPGYVPPARHVR